MKFINNSIQIFCAAIFFMLIFAACDPCENKVCEHGVCDKGTCVCDAGYYLNRDNCLGVNMKYVGSGAASASQISVDANGDTTTLTDVPLVLEASDTDPYTFILRKFKNEIKNDVVFVVDAADTNVLSERTVTTTAGTAYTISGSKSGFLVTLIISEGVGGTTHTLKYGA